VLLVRVNHGCYTLVNESFVGIGGFAIMIEFQFQLGKAVEAMAYLLSQIGPTDKVKMTKLVYLADREHFLAHGYPITGDRQYAMKKGPIPRMTLKAINGEISLAYTALLPYIDIHNFVLSLRQMPSANLLTDSEKKTLDLIVREHGHKYKWDLVNETHRLPEYTRTYMPGTSTHIPYETIAELGGRESRYRHGRVVLSAESAAHMDCPYPPGK